MAYSFKKITDVPATTTVAPTDEVLIISGNEIKRAPKSEIGNTQSGNTQSGCNTVWVSTKNTFEPFVFYEGRDEKCDVALGSKIVSKDEIKNMFLAGTRILVFKPDKREGYYDDIGTLCGYYTYADQRGDLLKVIWSAS